MCTWTGRKTTKILNFYSTFCSHILSEVLFKQTELQHETISGLKSEEAELMRCQLTQLLELIFTQNKHQVWHILTLCFYSFMGTTAVTALQCIYFIYSQYRNLSCFFLLTKVQASLHARQISPQNTELHMQRVIRRVRPPLRSVWVNSTINCISRSTHPSCVLLSHIQSWRQAAQRLRVFVLYTVHENIKSIAKMPQRQSRVKKVKSKLKG